MTPESVAESLVQRHDGHWNIQFRGTVFQYSGDREWLLRQLREEVACIIRRERESITEERK